MYIIRNIHTYTNKKTGKTGTMETYYQCSLGGMIPVLGGKDSAKQFRTRKEAKQIFRNNKNYSVIKV